MLTGWIQLVFAAHLLGAFIGVGGVSFAEVFYTKAAADGTISLHERRHIRSTFWALRWGMSLFLISTFLLGVMEYALPATPQFVLTPTYWLQAVLTLAILFAGLGLSRRFISWDLASAMAFVAWWMILFLELWRGVAFSFLAGALTYIVATAVALGFSAYIRILLSPQRHAAESEKGA